MKILVRNLPRAVTETELKAMFDEHGTVQSCTLVMDKKTGGSKGFGFVEMPKVGEAKAAIKSLNGKLVDEQKIRVKKAEDRPETSPKRRGDAEHSSPEAEAKPEEMVATKKPDVQETPQAQAAQQSR